MLIPSFLILRAYRRLLPRDGGCDATVLLGGSLGSRIFEWGRMGNGGGTGLGIATRSFDSACFGVRHFRVGRMYQPGWSLMPWLPGVGSMSRGEGCPIRACLSSLAL